MTKSQHLRGLICGRYTSLSALARQMDWGRQKLQRIVMGQQIPTIQEVQEMAISLEVPLSEMAEFFCPKNHRTSNKQR